MMRLGFLVRFGLVLSLPFFLPAQPVRAQAQRSPSNLSSALLAQFDKFDLVALGETHGTHEDQDVRIQLVRNPRFAEKVRNVVIECGNALPQDTLNRYIAGEDVPRQEIQRVWRDTTQSPMGAGDSPVCEQFLNEIRSINQRLPHGRKLHVFAGDPPIDWSQVKTPEEFQKHLRNRDRFPAELIVREILGKNEKALIVYGAGHIWRRNALVPGPNLATLIDQSNPGKLSTVIRLGGIYSGQAVHRDPPGRHLSRDG